jgi:DNA modification methylase
VSIAPYYDDGQITVYLGDCRDILPMLGECDLILTDPPYGIGADRNLRANKQHGKALAPSKDYGAGEWDGEAPSQHLLDACVAHAANAIVWGGNYFQFPPMAGWLVWDKDNGSNGYADCELAWTNLPQAIRMRRHRWMGMLQEYMGADKEERLHPTQKPLPLMRWCLELVPAAQTILDPFAGSLTTAVAAKHLGRRCIAVEREEKYIIAGLERLRQGVLL